MYKCYPLSAGTYVPAARPTSSKGYPLRTEDRAPLALPPVSYTSASCAMGSNARVAPRLREQPEAPTKSATLQRVHTHATTKHPFRCGWLATSAESSEPQRKTTQATLWWGLAGVCSCSARSARPRYAACATKHGRPSTQGVHRHSTDAARTRHEANTQGVHRHSTDAARTRHEANTAFSVACMRRGWHAARPPGALGRDGGRRGRRGGDAGGGRRRRLGS